MMAGVNVGVSRHINWMGVTGTCLGGRLSGDRVVVTVVTFCGNSGGVRIGTLRDGTEQSVWSTFVGAGRGVFGAFAVGAFSVTLEKMRKSVWMEAN